MKIFTNILLKWFETEKRDLPWKQTSDPYKIWISEIILQQTRVDQGTPYYKKFIKAFPTIKNLADADEDVVLKMWEGLGYYSRARNLHFTAKHIVLNHNGIFPNTYDEILKLKGIGPYTAAAIMSYAFKKPYPVVDGNVLRIVSRYLGITDAIDSSIVHKKILDWLNIQIPQKNPQDFNQALMDFGSSICTPKKFKCIDCPLSNSCQANEHQLQNIIPFKSKTITKKNRYFHYLIINKDNSFFINKRIEDIWIGLYEFPLIEKKDESILSKKEIKLFFSNMDISLQKVDIKTKSAFPKHILTHQNIYTSFYELEIEASILEKLSKYFILVSPKNIAKFAFPKIVNDYIAVRKKN